MSKKHTKNHHITIYNNCGDADITSSFTNKHVDPVLKLYTGIPIMLNSNEHIEQGRGNGILARFKKVVLKDNVMLTSKLWDKYHVNTVSVDDVKFIVCEHWENGNDSKNSNKSARLFKLKAEVTKVDIKMNLFGNKKKTVFTNQYIKQFGILVNTATTGHKLQGLSMDYIIIVSWFYGAKNWVYVVLSRVRTLRGLYLFKPLEYKKYFKEDNKLKKHMKELEEIETETLRSVEKFPKTSSLQRQEPTTTSRPITGDVLLNSKAHRGNNNKRNRTQSAQTSKTLF